MAIYYPDILEHNNPNYPLLDPTFLKGTAYPLASISTTGSIPDEKRNVGMIVFDSGSGKFYGYKGSDVANWATASNWIEFGSGTGSAGSALDHLFDVCVISGSTYDGYSAGGLNLAVVTTGSTLIGYWGENLGYTVGDNVIIYIDDQNYVKGVVSAYPGGLGIGSISITVNTVVGTAESDNHCITLDLAKNSYISNTQTGSFLYSGSYDSAASAITLYSKSTNYTLDLSGLAGGGGGFPITASNEGSDLTNSMSKIDFVGNAVTATNLGSIVTVTINTGSAASATDITALNNFTGSAQISLNALNAATGSYYYSSSVSNATITFNQGGGTTEQVTVNNINNAVSASYATTASYAPNLYNSDGYITSPRVVTLEETLDFETQNSNGAININLFQTGSFLINYIDNQSSFKITSLPTQAVPRILGLDSNDRVVSMSTSSIAGGGTTDTGSLLTTGSVSNATLTFTKGNGSTFPLTVNNVNDAVSASYAPNIYNTNGVLTDNRTLDVNGNTLNIAAQTGDVIITSDTSYVVAITDIPQLTQSSLVFYNEGSGQLTYNTTSSFTASQALSSSFASNALTASYVLNAVSASYAPNLYNTDGTLTSNRTVSLGNSTLMFKLSGTGEFHLSDGDIAGPNTYDLFVSGSGLHAQGLLINQTTPDIVGFNPSTGRLSYFSTGSFGGGGTTDTGSLMVTGSVSNATLTFTKGNGSTFPLTINNVANATTAGSVTSDSVYAEAGTDFDVWVSAGSIFTILDVNSTNIQVTAPKTAGDGTKLLAVATMEVYRASSDNNNTGFQYRLYNNTQAVAIPGSTRDYTSYLIGSGEGPIPTTFTFTIPISSDITAGDIIELQVKESPAALLGTYSSASISYADLSLISITS